MLLHFDVFFFFFFFFFFGGGGGSFVCCLLLYFLFLFLYFLFLVRFFLCVLPTYFLFNLEGGVLFLRICQFATVCINEAIWNVVVVVAAAAAAVVVVAVKLRFPTHRHILCHIDRRH